MSLARVTNYLPINPRLATAGMPTKEQIELLVLHEFQNVINLALDDSPGALENEAELVNKLGLNYYHIPVIWENPLKSDFDKFVSIMQTIKNEKTFIHCVLNMRVSVFVYLFRVHLLHESAEPAYLDILKIWYPDQTWQSFMKEIQEAY